MLKVNFNKTEYPFNQKTKDNIEFTRNELELNYIKKYNKCIESNIKIKGGQLNNIIVFCNT